MALSPFGTFLLENRCDAFRPAATIIRAAWSTLKTSSGSPLSFIVKGWRSNLSLAPIFNIPANGDLSPARHRQFHRCFGMLQPGPVHSNPTLRKNVSLLVRTRNHWHTILPTSNSQSIYQQKGAVKIDSVNAENNLSQ